ncbi:hypothetical protein C1646_773212 [Rhizophagus diaphanus]|nr:hypothetical protein C1646_773212 [Rhizophagus diaphanus] [Rhizophagus sp. MUCL 43196]
MTLFLAIPLLIINFKNNQYNIYYSTVIISNANLAIDAIKTLKKSKSQIRIELS